MFPTLRVRNINFWIGSQRLSVVGITRDTTGGYNEALLQSPPEEPRSNASVLLNETLRQLAVVLVAVLVTLASQLKLELQTKCNRPSPDGEERLQVSIT